MIRAGDLTLFSALEAGEIAPFRGTEPRMVRITFNAPQRSVLYVIPMADDGSYMTDDTYFLAVVEGLEEVEFYAHGPFGIHADVGRIWWKTVDGIQVHADVPDAETFTRISERRVRDPVVEQLQHMMMVNEQRRMAPLYNDLDRMRRELETLRSEREPDDTGTGADGGDSPPPQQAAGTGQPASGAQPAPSGTEGA